MRPGFAVEYPEFSQQPFLPKREKRFFAENDMVFNRDTKNPSRID